MKLGCIIAMPVAHWEWNSETFTIFSSRCLYPLCPSACKDLPQSKSKLQVQLALIPSNTGFNEHEPAGTRCRL